MKLKSLIIPDSKKWKGLKVFCPICGTTVSEICKKTGKPIAQCKNGDRHFFKVFVHVPGTGNQRRTKKLETRDLSEAIKQSIEFEKEVKSGKYQSPRELAQNKKVEKGDQTDDRPNLLKKASTNYIDWLKNKDVPAHLVKTRSQEHINDVERALKVWEKAISEKKYDIESTTIEDIDNNMVGIVFQKLEKKGFAPRTFNKYMSYYTSFLTWYAEEYDIPIRNYFKRVKRKNLNPNPQAITQQEFRGLLEKLTPENGRKEYEEGKRPTRNLYHPWLADGFRLALETGRRREEIINMKWNDLRESEGVPYIIIEDFKVNRIQGRTSKDEKKYVYVPVTGSLSKLLNELGREAFEGTDKYILAPDIGIGRNRVMADILSRGFSHYYQQLNTGRKLSFKSLRKTYITHMELFMGRGNTKTITGHSNDTVIERNYIDKKEIAKAAHGFEVFPEESKRTNDLHEIRTKREPETKNRER